MTRRNDDSPLEDDLGCEVCHREVGACDCPVCPTCGVQGDPGCYRDHGLTRLAAKGEATESTDWVTYTRRTDDPKLTYLERRLNAMGIPHRRNGFSFHAPILEVPRDREAEANAILNEIVDMGTGLEDETTLMQLDDIPDDNSLFSEE
jgi:hypothetical protein